MRSSGLETVALPTDRYPLPNLVELMANLMEHTTPTVYLTRRTLLEVYRRTSNKQAALDNPQEFAAGAVRIIKGTLVEHLVRGVKYVPLNDWYKMTLFDEEIPGWQDNLVPAAQSVYDHVNYDSEVERNFVAGLDARPDVKMYIKLPNWFTVPTPVGEYNPDWAIVMEKRDAHGEGREELYLVRETKSTTDRGKLRTDERHKVYCGEQHFAGALGVDYRVVTSANDLP